MNYCGFSTSRLSHKSILSSAVNDETNTMKYLLLTTRISKVNILKLNSSTIQFTILSDNVKVSLIFQRNSIEEIFGCALSLTEVREELESEARPKGCKHQSKYCSKHVCSIIEGNIFEEYCPTIEYDSIININEPLTYAETNAR